MIFVFSLSNYMQELGSLLLTPSLLLIMIFGFCSLNRYRDNHPAISKAAVNKFSGDLLY